MPLSVFISLSAINLWLRLDFFGSSLCYEQSHNVGQYVAPGALVAVPSCIITMRIDAPSSGLRQPSSRAIQASLVIHSTDSELSENERNPSSRRKSQPRPQAKSKASGSR